MTNVRSDFEQLPQEFLEEKLPSNLARQPLFNLSQTSRATHALFKNSLATAKLFYFIKSRWVDVEQVKKLVEISDPKILFQPISVEIRNNNSITISLVEYMFKMHDAELGKLFLERIKNNHTYLKLFLEQSPEKIGEAALKMLVDEYKMGAITCREYLYGHISDQCLLELWESIREKQRLFPHRLLNELYYHTQNTCLDGHGLNWIAMFWSSYMPTDIAIFSKIQQRVAEEFDQLMATAQSYQKQAQRTPYPAYRRL